MISVFVITFKSEKYLKRCLESIRFADEIVVVDSNSDDKTREIASSYGANLYQREFINFSDKKEFAKNMCSNNWVLNIDADEYVPEKTAKEILEAIKDDRYDCYYIPFITFFQGIEIKYGRHKNEKHIRLFKRDLTYGTESVHEKIKNYKNAGRLQNPIIHTPYENYDDIRNRAIRNANLSAKDKSNLNIFLLVIFILFNPIFRFIKEYIFLLGFLDKTIGLYLAYYSAKEVFLKYLIGLSIKLNFNKSPKNSLYPF